MEKYVKVRKIGEGSFGVAFLARTKENGKQVVLKEINMNKMTHKESDEARREVSVLAQLKHSNIVSYLESFELSGNLFIVMDFCDGGDLFGRINAQHNTLFPEEQILDWFVQMCLAVKHIHDRKILHRDIKSQNIFLTKHGIVKLGDFGIAKVLNSTVELARTCIGTPYYLSPEICEARPYNNKSDIWSLGCVLYELTTLKHAFEAPSMKALVLNIVRGIYPPPSSKYSADIRNLIALLFRKNPRDRPSVNAILKKPLLQAKIRKFLSELEIAEEFSHTVMHGMKIQKAIQSPQPRPLPPRPSSAAAGRQPPPSPYAPRYNPAAVYGPSIACRKSRENLCKDNKKSPEVRKSVGQDRPNIRRPSNSGNSRPPSAGPVTDLAKRRQEFIEKEKERREEVRKKQEQEYARQHKELLEKQKFARMNRNREDGWRSVLNSSNSEEKEAGVANAIVVRKIGNYDQHLAQLRKLEERSQDPVSPSQPNTPKQAEANPLQAAKLGLQAGNAGAMAADKARIYEEFIQRKEAAALNRARAQGGIVLPPNPVPSPLKPTWAVAASPNNSPVPGPSGDRTPVARMEDDKKKEELPGVKASWVVPPATDQVSSIPSDRPSSARIRDEERRKQEEDYMARLRQIRLQNFNERCMREKNAAQIRSPANVFQSPESMNSEAELRKKKIEALRAQAEARAKQLKEELEERRMQMFEERPRPQEPQALGRPFGLLPNKVDPSKPSVGLTAAMVAIGAAVPERVEPVDVKASIADQDPSSVRKTKQEILKRINSNISKPSTPQRGKWSEAGVTNILGQMEMEAKARWSGVGGVTNVLGEMDLEENHASESETKTSGAKVFDELRDGSGQEAVGAASVPTPRRQWPAQRGTVVDILNSVAICDSTTRGATVAIKSLNLGGNTRVVEPPREVSNPDGAEVVVVEGNEAAVDVVAVAETTGNEAEDVADSNLNDLEVKPEALEPPPKQEEERPVADGGDRKISDSSSEHHPADEAGEAIPGDDARAEDADPNQPDAELGAESSSESPLEVDDLEGPEDDLEGPEEEEGERLFERVKGLSLKQGLTTGHFDAPDVKLLRTCSEPDLHKLCLSQRPREQDAVKKLPTKSSGDVRDEELDDLEMDESQALLDEELAEVEELCLDFSATDLESEELDDTITKDDVEGAASESLLIESEDEDAGEESDDSDMRTLRETMANILARKDHESSGEEISAAATTKTKKKAKKGKSSKKGKKKKTKDSSNEETNSLTKVWSDTSLDDFQSMKETMKSLLQPPKPSASSTSIKPKSTLTLSAIAESSYVSGEVSESRQEESLVNFVQSIDSSDSEEIDRRDDDYFEDDGIFAHLEGIRASLEDQLGCETFLKAYATVQSFQEEDEDMEEGIKTVTRILGPDNVYLYPSILQLVMADAAFADNG